MSITRKFLNDLGIEKEIINSIMSEYGSVIEEHKAEVKTLNEKLADVPKGVDKSELEKLEKERDDYKNKLDEIKTQGIFDSALKDIKFSSNGAKKAFVAEMKEKLKIEDDKLTGFDKFLEEYKKSDEGAFEKENPKSDTSLKHKATTSELSAIEQRFYELNPNLKE